MAKIQYLKDSEGSIVFPVTHENAIKDSDGVFLKDKLLSKEQINQLLDEKQDILSSGVNIKKINNIDILGEGNINTNHPAAVYFGEIVESLE